MNITIVSSVVDVVAIVLSSEIPLMTFKYLCGQCGSTNSTRYSNSCAGPWNSVGATDVTQSIVQ